MYLHKTGASLGLIFSILLVYPANAQQLPVPSAESIACQKFDADGNIVPDGPSISPIIIYVPNSPLVASIYTNTYYGDEQIIVQGPFPPFVFFSQTQGQSGSGSVGLANSWYGAYSGRNVTGDANASFGYGSGSKVQGDHNTAMGTFAGCNVTGNANIANGYAAGIGVTGSENIATGAYAGQNVVGDSNIAIGSRAGSNVTASNTVSIGTDSAGSAESSVAIGNGATASGDKAVAIGAAAKATAAGSVAIGEGSVANTENTVSVGSVGKERSIVNVAAGRVAAGSTDAVNGGQLYNEASARAAADAALQSNLDAEVASRISAVAAEQTARQAAISVEATARQTADNALQSSVTSEIANRSAADIMLGGRIDAMGTQMKALSGRVDRLDEKVREATAMSVALGGAVFLPDTHFNLTTNVGHYDGKTAGSVQFIGRVSRNVAVNAGAAFSFNGGPAAFRGGFTFGW